MDASTLGRRYVSQAMRVDGAQTKLKQLCTEGESAA